MRRPLAFLVLLLSVIVTYARMLDAPLIWDDRHLILESTQISQSQPILQRFREPFWVDESASKGRAYYRPLTVLSFALDHSLHGENPAGYHLTNVVLHALNALLLLALLLRQRVDPRVALLLGMAWALEPRLTEAAAWVSGRTDLLACAFCLLALLVHRPRSMGRSLLSAGLLFLGLASKEVAVAGVATLVVRELQYGGSSAAGAERAGLSGWRFTLPPLGALLTYLWLRSNALGSAHANVSELSLAGRLVTALEALGRYAFDVAVPWLPNAQQGQLGYPDYRFVALALLLTLGLGLALRRAHAKATSAESAAVDDSSFSWLQASTLGGVSLLLVLHLIPLSHSVVSADRFLYLPLAALALGLVRPLSRMAQDKPRISLALLGLTLTLGVATVHRLNQWRSELEFWRSTYQAAPKTNALPGNELGNVFYRAGLFEMALRVYQVTAKQAIGDAHVLGNAANSLSQLGRYDEALNALQRLCAARPEQAKYCLDAALVEVHELQLGAARELVRETLKRAPQYAAANDVRNLIEQLETMRADAELRSPEPIAKTSARFRLAVVSGRRPDALDLGQALLLEPRASTGVRRAAAEYYVRFGSPANIAWGLASSAAAEVFAARDLREVAALRLEEGQKLSAAWPSLGFGSVETNASHAPNH
jgi:tetratricopeptide (TPR) repeat protein